jgi:WD40 repeat protein
LKIANCEWTIEVVMARRLACPGHASANFQFSIFDFRFSIPALLLAVLLPGSAAARPPITAATFAPDGHSVVLGSQSGLEVRTWPALAAAGNLPTRLANVHDLAFSPRGDVLAVAGGDPAESGGIELLRWPDGELIRRDQPHKDLVHAIAWRPDGAALATAAADRAVLIQDAATGAALSRLIGHSRGVLTATWLADGSKLITGAADQTLRVWGAADGQEEPGWEHWMSLRTLDNHTGAIAGLALRPAIDDGPPWLASIGADRTLRFWQPSIGRLVRFARLDSEPLSVAWTDDGKLAAAACVDGRLRLVDPASAEVVGTWPAIAGWAYTLLTSPDGQAFLVAGGDGEIAIVHAMESD